MLAFVFVAVSAALESSGCCQLTKERLKEAGAKPGALWHVFDPLDADKIRDLLNKVQCSHKLTFDTHICIYTGAHRHTLSSTHAHSRVCSRPLKNHLQSLARCFSHVFKTLTF